ncbi:MAG: hypothetical protein JW931_07965 [Methanomicrobiaceae archaeon]|nr:hypothetical protein [Methanomicrobiaceae archaeon]
MPQGKRALLCMTLGVFIALFLTACTPCAALNADITEGNLLESQNEADIITYTIQISGIPKQTKFLEISTDLVPVSEAMLWEIPDTTYVEPEGGGESLNDQKIELEVIEYPNQGIMIKSTGRVPLLTSVEITDGVVITKRDERKTGYVYYNVQALDENGDLLGTAATETFSITIPGEAEFIARVNAVSDPEMRAIIDDLYSRGLRDEAEDLLDYMEAPKESTIAFSTAIIIAIVLIIIGFVAGVFLGQIRARNMQDFQDEYRGN